MEAAVAAQKKLITMTLERRKAIIASIREAVLANNETTVRHGGQGDPAGTLRGQGSREHPVRDQNSWSGRHPATAHSGDHGLMLLEYAPGGVIGASHPDYESHRDADQQQHQHDLGRKCGGL